MNKDGTNSCAENCLNRMLGIECVGNRDSRLGEKDPYWNCNCGPNCGNRLLGSRRFAKCKPNHKKGKEWGLITLDGLKEESLVQEYVGKTNDGKNKEETTEGMGP